MSVQLCRIKQDKVMTKADVMEAATNRKRKSNDDDTDSDSELDDEYGANVTTNPAVVKALKQISDLKHLNVCGIDLGMRNIASTVRRTWHGTAPDNYEIHESNILHKSKDYHFNAGKHIYYVFISH